MNAQHRSSAMWLAASTVSAVMAAGAGSPLPLEPLLRAVDLNIGESRRVLLSDGSTATDHAAYRPTRGVSPGDLLTFEVRTFGVRPDEGDEIWDFGDGTPPVHTRSDGNAQHHAPDGYAVTTHAYAQPGHYTVTVQRSNDRGETATARLLVHVAEE